jgi:hypothetical protein
LKHGQRLPVPPGTRPKGLTGGRYRDRDRGRGGGAGDASYATTSRGGGGAFHPGRDRGPSRDPDGGRDPGRGRGPAARRREQNYRAAAAEFWKSRLRATSLPKRVKQEANGGALHSSLNDSEPINAAAVAKVSANSDAQDK